MDATQIADLVESSERALSEMRNVHREYLAGQHGGCPCGSKHTACPLGSAIDALDDALAPARQDKR